MLDSIVSIENGTPQPSTASIVFIDSDEDDIPL